MKFLSPVTKLAVAVEEWGGRMKCCCPVSRGSPGSAGMAAALQPRGWYWNARPWKINVVIFTKILCYSEQIVSDGLLASSDLGLCLYMHNSQRKKEMNGWEKSVPSTGWKKIICKVLCCISAPGTNLVNLQIKQKSLMLVIFCVEWQ